MRKRLHSLRKPKVRADWSKWTLYNISRMKTPSAHMQTFYQQKWYAKSATRAYHGYHIREGTWSRMFDRRIPAVVPMDHKVLARTDGSDQAAGRGSGVDVDPRIIIEAGKRPPKPKKTPYMQMTYWPVERRLDTAIWRALFASSARQARQFVVHGFVKVNGKKMEYPGYLLNPGDMFQVEPDRVLFATGARKYKKTRFDTLQGVVDEENDYRDEEEEDELNQAEEAEADNEMTAEEAAAAAEPIPEDPKKALQALTARAKTLLTDSKSKRISGKRKQDLRDFNQEIKRALSRLGRKQQVTTPIDETIDGLAETLDSIMGKITDAAPTAGESTADIPSSNPQRQDPEKEDAYNSRRDAELLHRAIQRAQENPIDVRKPYATPWQPREFMSAFAFIPRYLEVNQLICSAVYLRHPVARPGVAEVPTPFSHETGQLSFNWYLRRR